MAAVYLLDANIFIAALNRQAAVLERLEQLPSSALLMSAIVLGELEFGAEKSVYGERTRARLAALIDRMPLIGIDRATALSYARLRAVLERQGTPIGANDMWIAAQALALGATVVTDNEREFRRVPGLNVENWIER